MRKIGIVFLCFMFVQSLSAQENNRVREIGLSTYNLDNFGVIYKTGNTNSLWRFSLLNLSGHNSLETRDSLLSYTRSAGFGLTIGKEFVKPLDDKLDFRIGGDISCSYTKQIYERDDLSISNNDDLDEQSSLMPGLKLVAGLQFKMNEHFYIGAEFLPGISYSIQQGSNITKRQNVSFSTGSVRLSLLYRL